MRIRTIKPEWLDDERICLASAEARVMSIALIVMADDHGNGRAHPRLLAGRVFPGLDASIAEAAMAELEQLGFAARYEVDGQTYYTLRNWAKHQRIDNAAKPRVPLPSAVRGDSPRTAEERRVSPLDHDHDRDHEPEGTTTTNAHDVSRSKGDFGARSLEAAGQTTFAIAERSFAAMRLDRTGQVWKRPTTAYQACQDVADWAEAAAKAEGKTAAEVIAESLAGFAADSWADNAGYPFKAWASDPGKCRTGKGKRPRTAGPAPPRRSEEFEHDDPETFWAKVAAEEAAEREAKHAVGK